MTRRLFVDTEWTAKPWAAEAALLWIGLADETGRSWCGLSAEAEPVAAASADASVSGALRLIGPDVPRLTRPQLAEAVRDFCGPVDAFWAWVPSLESFASWYRLASEAPALYARSRDVDLRMLQALVSPWPPRWPERLHDLRAAAQAAGVEPPPRAANHLHPRVHVGWNRQLFERIARASPASV